MTMYETMWDVYIYIDYCHTYKTTLHGGVAARRVGVVRVRTGRTRSRTVFDILR